MKKCILILFAFALSVGAFAQNSRSELQTNIDANLASGSNLTAAELRTQLKQISNSAFNLVDDNLKDSTWIDSFINDLLTPYITDYTVTEGDVTAHEGALTITASQVSDFDTEVSNNSSVVANTAKVTFPGFTDLSTDYSFTDNSSTWDALVTFPGFGTLGGDYAGDTPWTGMGYYIGDGSAFDAAGAAAAITATDVGLGNVTNESKATMFTNPTFTGVQKVGSDTLSTKAYARSVGGGASIDTTSLSNRINAKVDTSDIDVNYTYYNTHETDSVAIAKADSLDNVLLTSTETFTNKRWTARVGSTTSSATPTINTDNYDIYKLTAQAADITSFTTNLSGTPVDGDILEIQITGTAVRAITWGTSFVASTVDLPTTTVTTVTLTVIFQYYTTSSYGNNKWVCANSF